MRTLACAVALAVLLGGCVVSARHGVIGDDVRGADVAQTIDTHIAPTLRTVPGLAVAPAACPEHLDVSVGKTGYCVLQAGGIPLRIAVTGGSEYGKFFVKQADTLIDLRDLERSERATLAAEYALHADVRCSGPRFRLAVAGMRLACALSGRGLPADHVDIKVLDKDGHVFFFRPHGVQSPSLSPLMPYLHSHKTGRPTVVPGRLIARYIETSTRSAMDGVSKRLGSLGTATCPAAVDLSATRRGLCRQRVAGKQLRVEVWLDEPGGIHIQSLDFALDTKTVAAAAARLYRAKLEAAGYTILVGVDCGPDRIAVVTQTHGLACKLTYGAKTRPLTAYPDAGSRGLRFYVPPM